MSRGRGPKRHGLVGARWAAGQPRASPPLESRLESVGAGRACGEAGPCPLIYRYQVSSLPPSAQGTAWELAGEGRKAKGRVWGTPSLVEAGDST